MLSLRSLASILCSAIRRARALSSAALHCFPDIINGRTMATNNAKKMATNTAASMCSLLRTVYPPGVQSPHLEPLQWTAAVSLRNQGITLTENSNREKPQATICRFMGLDNGSRGARCCWRGTGAAPPSQSLFFKRLSQPYRVGNGPASIKAIDMLRRSS
jgi:hypothetical protein